MSDSEKTPTSSDIEAAIRDVFKAFNNDLSSLTSKRVRSLLGAKFDCELSDRKAEIDSILMRLIDEVQDDDKSKTNKHGSDDEEADKQATTSNGSIKQQEHSDSGSPSPAKRPKQQTSSDNEQSSSSASGSDSEDDAEMARKLQHKELGMRPRKEAVASKKSSKRSDDGDGGKKPKARAKNSIYSEECYLSDELADVVGCNRMARNQVVKKMWQIFRERNLQDPKNKQFVICDEQLLKVFKVTKFKAFGMMKYLKAHMKDPRHVDV